MIESTNNLEIINFIILSAVIFTIGICGILLNRKNLITILMSIELILLSININFIAFSVKLNDITGHIYSIFILTVAAAEAAIGLAILVAYYRNRNTINVEQVNEMKG